MKITAVNFNISKRPNKIAKNISFERFLTKYEQECIIKRYKQGEHPFSIANYYRISENEVLEIVSNFQKTINGITKENIERIRKLYSAGRSETCIASEFLITPEEILNIIENQKDSYELRIMHNKYEKIAHETKDIEFSMGKKIMNMYRLGKSFEEIAFETGLTPKAVKIYIRKQIIY